MVAPGADPNAIAFAIVGADLRVRPGNQGAHVGAARRVAQSGRGDASPLHLDSNRDLVISTDAGQVRFHKPVVYQPVAALYERQNSHGGDTPPLQPDAEKVRGTTGGFFNFQSSIDNRQSVEGRFLLLASNRIGFEIANYDPRLSVIIDPVLSYSTYLGRSSAEWGSGIAVDSSGKVYVSGYANSTDFSTVNSYQDSNRGLKDQSSTTRQLVT